MPLKAKAAGDYKQDFIDSLHVYLLTCSPHQEVYSLYGHTAIRIVNNNVPNYDYAINYGVFDFRKPFFVLRFVFGLTDYEMGIYPTPIFKQEYMHYGSRVTEQEINMTADEKLAFMHAVDDNYSEQNRTYRYNYFYDNCTTRARDIIVRSIHGKVVFPGGTPPEGTTFREMIHSMNADYPWARLGNDLLLGVNADRQLTTRQMEFLPHVMMHDAGKAFITGANGTRRAFVSHEDELVTGTAQVVEEEFPLTPVQCAVIILVIVMAVTAVEWYKRRYLWYVDAILFVMQGLCGVILTAMIFSQHPTVSVNAQILVFNILPLLFGYQAVRRWMKGMKHWLWRTQSIFICLLIVTYSSGIQWIDPSVLIVACSLLLRSAIKETHLPSNEQIHLHTAAVDAGSGDRGTADCPDKVNG